MKPGSLGAHGWDGSEIVAFRLHLPSRILHHTARDLETIKRWIDTGATRN